MKAAALIVVAMVFGCGGNTPTDAPVTTASAPRGFPAGPVAATAPDDNPLTEARVALGKRLFYDTRLSRTNDIACASCHKQDHAFADSGAVSKGVDGRKGTRNAPALVNLAWSTHLFWDGRVATLEEQAGKPIENPDEMDLPLSQAVARLAADASYVDAFTAAYGAGPDDRSLRYALASFVRILVSGASPYDRFIAGDAAALSPAARRGEAIFSGSRGNCFHCHPQETLTNDGFFNNGTFVDGGDVGRQALTSHAADRGKFKVPGLRNVAASAPYMHDGSLATLEEVIDQYDRGGRGDASTDPQIHPLHLTADEKADLATFLRALSDETFLTDPRLR